MAIQNKRGRSVPGLTAPIPYPRDIHSNRPWLRWAKVRRNHHQWRKTRRVRALERSLGQNRNPMNRKQQRFQHVPLFISWLFCTPEPRKKKSEGRAVKAANSGDPQTWRYQVQRPHHRQGQGWPGTITLCNMHKCLEQLVVLWCKALKSGS